VISSNLDILFLLQHRVQRVCARSSGRPKPVSESVGCSAHQIHGVKTGIEPTHHNGVTVAIPVESALRGLFFQRVHTPHFNAPRGV
jgi:hypothetical protein